MLDYLEGKIRDMKTEIIIVDKTNRIRANVHYKIKQNKTKQKQRLLCLGVPKITHDKRKQIEIFSVAKFPEKEVIPDTVKIGFWG